MNRLLILCAIVSPIVAQRRFNDECREEKLRTNEGDAEVVVTGTVLEIHPPTIRGSSEFSANVRIKRVLKGDDVKSGDTKRIEGFGSAAICDSMVSLRDSRIFLLDQNPLGKLRLNGTLIRLTVPNLDRVAAVVKGEPLKRRAAILDEPCEKKYCPYNAECHVNRQGRASCQCPENCPIGYEPVCGSNGVTYPNKCRMRIDSCKKQQRVYVKRSGSCPNRSEF